MATDSVQPHPAPADRRTELERLKAERWPAEGREERIARALKALEGPLPDWDLPPEVWKQILEDPDFEDL